MKIQTDNYQGTFLTSPRTYLLLLLLTAIALTGCLVRPLETGSQGDLPKPSAVTSEAVLQAEENTQSAAAVSPSPLEINTPTPDLFSPVYPLGENTYIIPLSIRHVTEQEAVFFFELEYPDEGVFVYRNFENNTQGIIDISGGETRQMLTIDGLTPGSQYAARVLIGNPDSGFRQPIFAGGEWGAVRFETASDKLPLRVGVVGDASFGDEATQALVKIMTEQELDFVIHTGDVVYETDSSNIRDSYVRKFFMPFAPLLHHGPIYPVLGNHDYDFAVLWQGMPFYDYAFPRFLGPDDPDLDNRRGNQYYAFSYQDIQFLMLDTHVFAGGGGRAEQDAWLDRRLSDPRYRLTIPVFHVAPYSSSAVHPDDGLPVRYSWNRRFEEAEVPLVLSGHFHHYERLTANGVTYIVSGGGSSTLYAQGELLPESQGYVRKTHFVLLEIFQDHIDLRAIALGGEIIDQARIPLLK